MSGEGAGAMRYHATDPKQTSVMPSGEGMAEGKRKRDEGEAEKDQDGDIPIAPCDESELKEEEYRERLRALVELI